MRKYLLLLLLTTASLTNFAQVLQGKIVDEVTGEVIPFASIGILGTNSATVTNDAGEFVLRNLSYPIKIRYSHVSYLTVEAELDKESTHQIIKLKPAAITLQPVTIDPFKAYRILKSALEFARKYETKIFYGNAFYRQLTTLNGNASQIYELFYDVAFNVSKVKGWIAKQSRFAESNQGISFSISNQSYLTFSLAGSLLEDKKSGKTVTLKNLKDYQITIDKYIEQHNQQIAVISCKFKGNKIQHYINSTYYIGLADLKIYRLENSIFNLPMKLSKSLAKIPPVATTIATFKEADTGIPIIESISTKLYLNLTANGRNLKPVISSMLSLYRLDKQLNTQRFTELTKNVQDKAVIESIEYNPEFWINNPIVKQTSLESDFVKMMDSKSAFGTMINP